MHDDIIIKIQTVNGKPFKGTLTVNEAKDDILQVAWTLMPN